MSQTPGRTLGAEENQSTYEVYLEGWRDLNQRLARGEPWSGEERNVAFLNSGGRGADLDFVDAASVIGLDGIGDGRSAARIDIDLDGDDDIVLTNRTEPRVQVLRNRLSDGVPTLAVTLVGHGVSGTDALGGVVYATPVDGGAAQATEPVVPGRTQRRTRTAGSGYLAQSSGWLRFAFPESSFQSEEGGGRRGRRVRLAVRWPGQTELEDFGTVRLSARRLILEQGLGSAREVGALTEVQLAPAEVPAFDLNSESGRRLALPAPSSIPSLAVRGASGRAASLFGITPDGPIGADQPVVALVWDSSQPDAVTELGAVGALSEEVKAAGSLLISIDLAQEASEASFPEQLNRGVALLAAAGFDGDELAALGSTRGILAELVSWRLGVDEAPLLPWSLVVGPDGRLDVVRTGPWRAGEAQKDLIFCATLGKSRLVLASPFGGRWVNPPLEANLARLRTRLERRGLAAAARELNLARLTTASADSAEVQVRLGQTHLGSKDYERALRAFDAALAADPESALAHKARAYTLQLMGRFEESIESWGRAIALDPSDPNGFINRAFAAVESGALEQAEADLAQLEKLRGAKSEEAAAVRAALVRARADDGASAGKAEGDAGESGGRR